MTWNYRIIRYRDDGGYGLHEVYYDDSGQVTNRTSEPCGFVSDQEDGPDGIIRSLEMALADARSKPVLDEPEIVPLDEEPNKVVFGTMKGMLSPEDEQALLDAIEAPLADPVAAMRQLDALDAAAYFNQDILERINQARMVMELEKVDPLVWRDEGVGIAVSDVFNDAYVEIRRLRGDLPAKEQP